MIPRLSDLFPLLLVSGLGALLSAPLWTRLVVRWNLVDMPGSQPHKRHARPTALAGGLVLGTSGAVSYLLLQPAASPSVAAVLLAAGLMLLVGLLDDRRNLPPIWKLLGQIVCAAVLVGLGVQIHVTRLPALDIGLSFLWYIGLINAFNFVDSMDGLAAGLAAIAAAFFMLVSIDSRQPDLASLAAVLMGGCVGLLFFNTAPARLFLGDSGAQVLGLVLAGIGIAYVPGQAGLPQGLTWFTPILVLAVPIFDTCLVVFSRIVRGQPIYRGGTDHTFHRLVSLGLEPERSVLAMQLAAAALGLVAFIALDASVLTANLLFGAIVLAGAVAGILLGRGSGRPDRTS